MGGQYDRRDFLRLGASVGAGLALGGINVSGCASPLKGEPAEIKAAALDTVRIGFVGVGGMGSPPVPNLTSRKSCRYPASPCSSSPKSPCLTIFKTISIQRE